MNFRIFPKRDKEKHEDTEKAAQKMLCNPNTSITELYTLTHPFHYPNGHYNPYEYFKLWKDSLTKSAQTETSFAILYLCKYFSDSSLSYLNIQLVKHAKEVFGESRVLLYKSMGIAKDEIFSEDIKARLSDRKTTKVSGRGVFALQCVHGVVEATLDAYNIPRENGYIDFLESIDTDRDILGLTINRELFPNLEKREQKRKELGQENYEGWIAEKIAKFERGASFERWYERNFNLTNIKTYLGDIAYLRRKFADIKLEKLIDEDFDNYKKAEKIAIVYQFLINPLRFYSPAQLSTERFHINPTWQDPDTPKPWEANTEQVIQFRDDLSNFLLGWTIENDDISNLAEIVSRATKNHRVVIDID